MEKENNFIGELKNGKGGKPNVTIMVKVINHMLQE